MLWVLEKILIWAYPTSDPPVDTCHFQFTLDTANESVLTGLEGFVVVVDCLVSSDFEQASRIFAINMAMTKINRYFFILFK